LGETSEAEIRRQSFLTPDHFTPRLTQAQAQKIIDRVIRNAKRINEGWSRFYFDWIGIFGSVLNGSESPGDVDIVYSVRSSKDGTPPGIPLSPGSERRSLGQKSHLCRANDALAPVVSNVE
jgi:hypothetical protein